MLHGADVWLDEASVTGTENAVMAACLARGETVIRNAASEPHVQELCHFLRSMGAEIEGIGSNVLRIQGKERLEGGECTIGPDFMEVGSFIGLAAVTGGEILIKDAAPAHLGMIRIVFERLGVRFRLNTFLEAEEVAGHGASVVVVATAISRLVEVSTNSPAGASPSSTSSSSMMLMPISESIDITSSICSDETCSGGKTVFSWS